jgi:hypothetical protein
MRRPYPPATCGILTGIIGVSRSGCGRRDMANEETVKDHLPVKFPQMQVFCL